MKQSCVLSTEDRVELTDREGKGYTVRRLQRSDIAALQQFNRDMGADRVRFNPHAYTEDTLRKLLLRSERGDDLVLGLLAPATTENRPGGLICGYFFLWYFRERVPLLGIGLLPDRQGRGIGKQAVELLIDQARLAGCEGVELTTLPDNRQAFALYKKCGFEYFGDVKNRDGNGRLVVERALFYEIKPGARTMDKAHGPPV